MGSKKDSQSGEIRWPSRWLGAAIAAHLVWLIALQTAVGDSEQLLWLSYTCVAMVGIGLMARAQMCITAPLLICAIPHALWLLDLFIGMTTGVFPFHLATPLARGNLLSWISTSHHFFLLPILYIMIKRGAVPTVGSVMVATTVYIALLGASRPAGAADNINWSHRIFPAWDFVGFEYFSTLDAPFYLAAMTLLMSALVFFPTMRLSAAIAKQSESGSKS
jgi:hypothetical protein